ncbi:MAG TPA: hypothetical protein VK928_03095 [Longimicrobiales bacterium]|nr:hypothetical protein [Longimicrobiales bacterium]
MRMLTVFSAVLLGACSSGLDSAVFMSAPPLPATEEVRIYRTQRPECPYDELGLVTWQRSNGWKKMQEGVEKMRARAREMGGNAILDFSLGDRMDGTSTRISADSAGVSVGSTTTTSTLITGTVVRFRDAGCAR